MLNRLPQAEADELSAGVRELYETSWETCQAAPALDRTASSLSSGLEESDWDGRRIRVVSLRLRGKGNALPPVDVFLGEEPFGSIAYLSGCTPRAWEFVEAPSTPREVCAAGLREFLSHYLGGGYSASIKRAGDKVYGWRLTSEGNIVADWQTCFFGWWRTRTEQVYGSADTRDQTAAQ